MKKKKMTHELSRTQLIGIIAELRATLIAAYTENISDVELNKVLDETSFSISENDLINDQIDQTWKGELKIAG